MQKVVKQVAAVDVAQKELVVCLGRMYDDWSPELYAHKTFANTAKGIEAFVVWTKKHTNPQVAVRYVMEATGVYHESLAPCDCTRRARLSSMLPRLPASASGARSVMRTASRARISALANSPRASSSATT